jgi:hypothetical protein
MALPLKTLPVNVFTLGCISIPCAYHKLMQIFIKDPMRHGFILLTQELGLTSLQLIKLCERLACAPGFPTLT